MPSDDATPFATIATATTPTGTQSAAALTRRRVLVAVMNLALFAALAAWAATILGAGGWSAIDALLFLSFLAILPWTVLGVVNAGIGLWVLHGAADPVGEVAPFARSIEADAPIVSTTAIFMTLRNEDPSRAIGRLKLVEADLVAAGAGDRFAWFVLSDTDRDAVAAREEEAVAGWRAEIGERSRIVYRRRADNTGFKAGNVFEFLDRWGDEYDLMLPLDADSLMDAATILRQVRILDAHPRIGILQTLVVGLPSAAAFARVFQFGMRQGMRAYINGQAWWTGDCGQFWGHNALVRIAPFRAHCRVPVLPGEPPFGGHILSHDQIEAALMRRAGWEVRIVPEECGSWEENPPTLVDYMRRNVRWCQGNLQYLRLLGTPGLLPVSRFQLIWAILMFVSIPGGTLMLPLAALKPFDGEALAELPLGSALALYLVFLVLGQVPKLCGLADILLTRGGAARYGGRRRLLLSGLLEVIHSWFLGASDSFRITLFVVALAFGRSVGWGGQARDAHGLSWRAAVAELWPQTLFGVTVVAIMAATSPIFAVWSAPLTAGYLLAVPFCVVTARPGVGARLRARRLFAVPEELATPAIVAAALAGRG
jgi:membrane glycosyltransferase